MARRAALVAAAVAAGPVALAAGVGAGRAGLAHALAFRVPLALGQVVVGAALLVAGRGRAPDGAPPAGGRSCGAWGPGSSSAAWHTCRRSSRAAGRCPGTGRNRATTPSPT
ncbi:hypothetical protein Cma02nite_00680 [Cellulomonas marina]|nr:hypothetical protein Cma02nite_00680 [Cellulomonas marina]